MAETTTLGRTRVEGEQKLGIIDTDVHPGTFPGMDPDYDKFIPQRWRDYLGLIGQRPYGLEAQLPRQRNLAVRTDSWPPSGKIPGADPEFARKQVLDEYGMSAAVLNNIFVIGAGRGLGGYPNELGVAICQAANDWHREVWFADDPRWHASINVPYELPDRAAAEIERCRGLSDRYVQVLIERRQDYPIGNQKYWPIFEAIEHFDIPLAFHVGGNRRMTACGSTNYYFEEHCDFALSNFNCVSSLIFEGVFDRFPKLKIALIEQNWSWAVPFMWRLDASWRKLSAEIPDLQRKPSEYVRDHFWYSTQPMEEPENMDQVVDLFQLFVDHGISDKLMYSSDYPHWDFDCPTESVPESFPEEWRRKILGENAANLYGIALT